MLFDIVDRARIKVKSEPAVFTRIVLTGIGDTEIETEISSTSRFKESSRLENTIFSRSLD